MTFLNERELDRLGLRYRGVDIRISPRASLHGCERISIGSRSRIDDFVVLSAGDGGIEIGENVHVAVFSSLIGAGRISVGDFANLSSRVAIYSSNDDYSGESMSNPTVPDRFKSVRVAPVSIGEHAILGSGSVVLPGVTIGTGGVLGALSLAKSDLDALGIYGGVPAQRIGDRQAGFVALAAAYREESRRRGRHGISE